MRKTEQQEILNRWLVEHSGIFYKLVRVYASNHHDQEDLFQEIVVQVWHSIPSFQGTAKESTYIYQVALFAAMAWSQKERQQRDRVKTTSEVSDLTLFRPHPVDNPQLDWLYEQISKMSVTDRSLTLLLLDGYTYREIASLMGLTESNVGSRLTRMRKKLASLKQEET